MPHDLRIMPRPVEVAQLAQRLTPREIQVAAMAALKNQVIAKNLGITRATVKAHLLNIRNKTGLENRTQVALFADRAERRAA